MAGALNRQVLLVDDDATFRHLLRDLLESEDYLVHQAAGVAEARTVLEEEPIALVLLDMNMPGEEGTVLLRHIKELSDPIEVIVVSGQALIEVAVEALRLGAFHYLTKPVDLDEVSSFVRHALDHRRIVYENRLMRASRRRESDQRDQMVAVSKAMRQVVAEAQQAAELDAPVLISGETGVGKEVIAALIHNESLRAQEAFNAMNCGAVPEHLIDSEFFGHEKGAFTGADQMQPGIVEASDGGTLLLDEIGDIVEMAQIRLLRFLESSVIRRVGGNKEIPVDVRIIAASHRNLEDMVNSERFRADLYHRLNVIRIHIPPLRERRDDIIPLAEIFLDKLCSKYGEHRYLHESAHESLLHYTWPGNIRELRNSMDRAWYHAARQNLDAIDARHFQLDSDIEPVSAQGGVVPHKAALGSEQLVDLKTMEQRYIEQVLAACNEHRAEAARILGLTERSLYRRLSKLRDH